MEVKVYPGVCEGCLESKEVHFIEAQRISFELCKDCLHLIVGKVDGAKTENNITAEEFIRKRFNVPGNVFLREYFGPLRWDIDAVIEMLNAFADTIDQ